MTYYSYTAEAGRDWLEKAAPIAARYLEKFSELLIIRSDSYKVAYINRYPKDDNYYSWKPMTFQRVLELMWLNRSTHSRRIDGENNSHRNHVTQRCQVSKAEEYLDGIASKYSTSRPGPY